MATSRDWREYERRKARANVMRAMGHSYSQIARRLGVAKSTANAYCNWEVAEHNRVRARARYRKV